MKLTLSRLSVQKGSSISGNFPIELDDGETLTGWRASAFVKAQLSSATVICVMDAKVNTEKKTVDVSIVSPRSDSIPAGQLFYYVELTKGLTNKIVERNYLNVEP